MTDDSGGSWLRIAALSVVALVGIVAFYLFTADHELVFGSALAPTPQARVVYLFWFGCGLFTTFGAAGATSALLSRGVGDLSDEEVDDGQLLFLAMAAAFAIPWLLRYFVLQDAPIVDDESAYHFASQLLAHGGLTGESHPFKLFYDRVFLINDGETYTQYFLGWPILMLPGTLLGSPEIMNPLYNALALPPLFWLLRRLTNRRWAWAGVVTWLASPFLQLSAATLMSHTSCTTALMWGLWLTFRTTDEDATTLHHAGLALAFSVAFFVRPASALGIAFAPVVFWLWTRWRRGITAPSELRAIAGFVTVAVAMAAAFLAVNTIQNGGPFAVAYDAAREYARSNEFRFSPWTAEESWGFQFDRSPLTTTGIALFRLFISGLGWPIWVVLILIGAFHERARVFIASAVGMLLLLMFSRSIGVDPIGPVHYTELMAPLVVLTALAFHHLERWENARDARPRHIATALFVGSLVAGVAIFAPTRLAAVRDYNAPAGATRDVSEEIEGESVVFAPVPLVAPCATDPHRHFAFWRPFNDPDLQNDVIWVNHITVDLDRRLMEHSFPGRDGYVMAWVQPCRRVLIPLNAPPQIIGNLPDADPQMRVDDLEAEFEDAR